jgi:hypothetical protein
MDADNKKEIKQTGTPVPPPASKPKVVLVETYAEDMASVISSDAGSMVKKIIHSEEEHEAEKQNFSPQSKKNKIFILVGFLLLIVALALTLFLLSTKKTYNTVSAQPQFIPLVFTDKSTSLEIAGFKPADIAQAVFSEISNTNITSGDVEGIYLTENKQTIGLRRFITLIGSHFAPDNNPLLVSDNFLMGVIKNQPNVATNAGTGFFLLIKVRSATDIFDSLRAWEPNILTDLHGFFGLNISNTTNYLFTKNFTDGIIDNKNARILYDQNGNIVLMYIFADDNSILVTDSQNAANQIILRLTSSQVQ